MILMQDKEAAAFAESACNDGGTLIDAGGTLPETGPDFAPVTPERGPISAPVIILLATLLALGLLYVAWRRRKSSRATEGDE